ncbi:hypothetical protein GUITHDRAFT_118190 [Guillardia theta CCMP2712]|uniref:Uncharacterized protein n=1 Tax=Guillardia theta (strain CCMP2712) TaxID=905079 RepID=L1IH58_GUITC|nr:hypothetical protein GUITHDRAFT_118190 [Guillardia theta CCMP2712]EKX35591.1 hypothetical protein GUITHDRAFT_118190 [Guillardia theta CCMP2712]|eukprot:XP_005822571.1 hypothetical protein GUITHDRAFT_118190 [Guillardia theta CCMP2712]
MGIDSRDGDGTHLSDIRRTGEDSGIVITSVHPYIIQKLGIEPLETSLLRKANKKSSGTLRKSMEGPSTNVPSRKSILSDKPWINLLSNKSWSLSTVARLTPQANSASFWPKNLSSCSKIPDQSKTRDLVRVGIGISSICLHHHEIIAVNDIPVEALAVEVQLTVQSTRWWDASSNKVIVERRTQQQQQQQQKDHSYSIHVKESEQEIFSKST